MSDDGQKKGEELLDKALKLSIKVDGVFGSILDDLKNLSPDEMVKLNESGILNELEESMTRYTESFDKLEETIKRNDG